MKNYHCLECNALLQSDKKPNVLVCKVSSNGNHRWNELSEVGNDNYQCKSCSILVKSKKKPNVLGCRVSSNHNHSWNKL